MEPVAFRMAVGVAGRCSLEKWGVARGFRPVDRDTPMLLPPELREWLPDQQQVWVVLDVVAQLDLSAIRGRDALGEAGREAYHPGMLTALLIYAYCLGIISSRRIKAGCSTDVAFRVITAQQRPDHSTL